MKKNTMMSILAAVFAAIFLISAFVLWQDYKDQKESAEAFDDIASLVMIETESMEEPEETTGETVIETEPTDTIPELTAFEKYVAVYEQNSDFVGWMSIEGTNINYPVMQTIDEPNFYLKRAFDKSYSVYGVPYVQENCDLATSDNLVIYGHNMSNGSMFADLCKYESEDFYKEHPVIHFDTLTGYGEYEIVTVFKTVAYSKEGFKYYHFVNAADEDAFNTFMDRCMELSLYDTGVYAEYGDKLITLSTCEYSRTNGRMVIVAKLIVPSSAEVGDDA